MKIVCNGEGLTVPAESTLKDVLSAYLDGEEPKAMAVACNGDVVPQAQWSHRSLSEGDRLDLFTAVAGG
jgi:sulfur carrier protein